MNGEGRPGTAHDPIGPVGCSASHDPRWDVPDHRSEILVPRRSRHAVIVPVWNEGLRIRRQLHKMSERVRDCDIVIADGSSTDGSIDPHRLRSLGVHSLVTVSDRGASVALRAAMAHVLDEGYEGVILMDGNDKDDPAMLVDFVHALSSGFDYAQGSRYIPGGRGVNTPRSRDLLIRYVHAPLFSLACGRRFTDSTIGSRAFSRRLLLDPRVRPFRQEFRYYELYFYLGWAACHFGFRVSDVPVTRTYPATGPVPTKISVTRGNWLMIRPVIMLLLGRY